MSGIEQNKLGLYVHIPFCVQKCRYCDFPSFGSSGAQQRETYVEALIEEIRFRGRCLAEIYSDGLPQVDSIFLGGGTPSILAPRLTEQILSAIRECFPVSPDAEVTTEANPGTLSEEKLRAYRAMGINRLSMGVQTLDPILLKFLGRIHTPEDFFENFELARAWGFENINIDLIFALPGQTVEGFLRTLDGILALGPEHLSLYALQIEEGTPFYEMLRRGEIHQTSEELDRTMYHEALTRLSGEGYQLYEISNAARGAAYRCRHNLKYWSMESCLGLGLSAHSYLRLPGERAGRRFANHSGMEDYLAAAGQVREGRGTAGQAGDSGGIAAGQAVGPTDPFLDWEHENTLEEERSDYFFTEFRKTEGIDPQDYFRRFGELPEERYGAQIERFVAEGLLEWREAKADRFDPAVWSDPAVQSDPSATGRRLALTRRGLDLASTVIRAFL